MWWMLAILLALAYAASNFYVAWKISGSSSKGEPLPEKLVSALYWGNAGVAGVLLLVVAWWAYATWKKAKGAAGGVSSEGGSKSAGEHSSVDSASEIAKL